MAVGISLQLHHEFGGVKKYGWTDQFKSSEMKSWRHLPSVSLSSCASRQDVWSLHVSNKMYKSFDYVPFRCKLLTCRCFGIPNSVDVLTLLKNTSLSLGRSLDALRENPFVMKVTPAIGIIAFTVWGLGPVMRYSRSLLLHKNDNNWKKSKTHYVFTSYLQPLLLWTGATLICRAFDPVVLPSEASQAVKQRLLNFVKSLSTVLAFAYCLTSLIQQMQKFFIGKTSSDNTRNMGFQFAGRAVYTAVWIAAFSLFMELVGFSTQKWVTAGGLGTVLLTLAGREIFTNFLSSIMIHATRPFVLNEWIQANIQGYEVSGTVEQMGWWSPTIIRGEDREAVHIPNHKFTVNVVRNLSQKTHWRIKTHLAISHLDVNKISNIVADMRKVLAKNPQIEQQRLHRRVFLDNINPENQALLILISCFVKTSHFEEYLCVKEAVMLDLLRVVSHHRARLATPIRTMQKMYSDPTDMENIPFSDTIFTRTETSLNRSLLLIEPSQRINGDEKAKSRTTTTPRSNEEPSGTKNDVAPDPKKSNAGDPKPKSSKGEPKSQTEASGSEKVELVESERPRPVFEDNIVLGVALEGSKRTLPIEEEVGPGNARVESSSNGSSSSPSNGGKDRKSQMPGVSEGSGEVSSSKKTS